MNKMIERSKQIEMIMNAKSTLKSVNEDEYYKFVRKYPNNLEWDVYRVIEPPRGCCWDFSIDKPLVSMVSYDYLKPNGEIVNTEDKERFYGYYIKDENEDE